MFGKSGVLHHNEHVDRSNLNHLCGVLLQQVPVMNTDSTTEQPKR